MNQILVTQKLYVTPELRRKKKMYKVQFFLSIFLVCLLSTYYIYAEYDRSKTEAVSKDILADFRKEEGSKIGDGTTVSNNNQKAIIIALDDEQETPEPAPQPTNSTEYTAADGTRYKTESVLTFERLEINYPIITPIEGELTEELLKISLNKYWGPAPNEIGNYCVVGHNYKSKKMFGRLHEAVNGDIVTITDLTGRTIKYEVYDRYVVDPTDVSCTSQLTNGKREISLITCTNYGQQRLVVKAREVK